MSVTSGGLDGGCGFVDTARLQTLCDHAAEDTGQAVEDNDGKWPAGYWKGKSPEWKENVKKGYQEVMRRRKQEIGKVILPDGTVVEGGLAGPTV